MKKAIFLFIILAAIAPAISGQKLKADEIIARHLSSIGTPEKRSALKTLIAIGEVQVDHITNKTVPVSGRFLLFSEGNKSFFGLQLNANDYPHEKVIFDGSKTDVAFIRGGTRSQVGNFIQSNSSIVSQGLMAGTLATSWNLLTAVDRGAKIAASGSKKVNGKEAYVLSIVPKGGSDLDITLFFDQETFRHVRTEYKRTSSAAMGNTIDQSARNIETRFKVTEDYSDHAEFEGMTIPRKYRLHYSVSGQNGTVEIAWNCNLTEFALNQTFDPSTFQISKNTFALPTPLLQFDATE